ncbi:MAG TPA: glycosyltransferase [Pyrinomonadaceae bacterium]|nr:glycosyltransferase [Pyrinomonadaceae bacterium]
MKSTGPKISVVLPVYNGERYLKLSIDSVLGQSFTDFEFIIWDDGSTDNTSTILANYSDPRIQVFSNERNLGLFTSLNKAIEKSNGPLIRLWAQDDIMKPECLEREYEFVQRNPSVAMFYSQCITIDQNGQVVGEVSDEGTPAVIEPQLAAQIMFYHGSITGNIANVTLKKSALHEAGLFREDLIVSGDFEMWVRLSERWPIGFLKEPLVYLRSHEGQFSRRKGLFPTFMREDALILEKLTARLPPSLCNYAIKYDRRHRQLSYVHHVMHCFLWRDWRTASETFREIRQRFNPLLLFWLWLVTVDRRLFKLKPKYELTEPTQNLERRDSQQNGERSDLVALNAVVRR